MEMTRFSDLAIRTRGLRKVFGGKVAVRNLTLDVPRGEVFGFLGPNGAGKSTSVKMLLGLVLPTSGEAQILGCPDQHSKRSHPNKAMDAVICQTFWIACLP